jgi:hypothetical protein
MMENRTEPDFPTTNWGARKQEFYHIFLRLMVNSASCRAPNPYKMDLDIRVIDRLSQLLNLNSVLGASGSIRCSAVPGGNFLLLPEYFLALHIGALSKVHVNRRDQRFIHHGW